MTSLQNDVKKIFDEAFGDSESVENDNNNIDQEQASSDEAMVTGEEEPSASETVNKERKIDEQEEDEDFIAAELELIEPTIPKDENNLVQHIRLPHFIKIEGKAFTSNSLERKDTFTPEEAAALENTIRWKLKDKNDKNSEKISNTKFIRWSDGSTSLMIGSDMYEVFKFGPNDKETFLYQTDKQTGAMQLCKKIDSRLGIRPYSVNSSAHAKVAQSVSKHTKEARIQYVKTTVDPNKQKEALEELERERAKQRRKQEARQLNMKQTRTEESREQGLTRALLEEDFSESESDKDEYETGSEEGSNESGSEKDDKERVLADVFGTSDSEEENVTVHKRSAAVIHDESD